MKGVLTKEDVSADDKVTLIMSEFNAEINGLKSKNQELIGKEKKYKSDLDAMTTKNGDFEKQISELTKQIKNSTDDKSKEEFYNNQLALKQKAFDEQIKLLMEERDTYKKYKIETLKTAEINKGIEGLKFVDDALKEGYIAVCLANNHFEPKDIDGKTVFLNDDQKQLSDVLKEFALSEKGKSFIANGNSGGGASSATQNTNGVATSTRENGKLDISQLMQMYKNPATKNIAKQMAVEAGLKVF